MGRRTWRTGRYTLKGGGCIHPSSLRLPGGSTEETLECWTCAGMVTGEPLVLAEQTQGASYVRVLQLVEDAEPMPETMTPAAWDVLPPWAGPLPWELMV